MTLAKRAPECSETSIRTQNARNMMCSEHFWKMKRPDCSESSKNWHVGSSAGFWWLSPKTVEAKRSSTAARRKGSAMLRRSCYARLQLEVARRSFANGSFRPLVLRSCNIRDCGWGLLNALCEEKNWLAEATEKLAGRQLRAGSQKK